MAQAPWEGRNLDTGHFLDILDVKSPLSRASFSPSKCPRPPNDCRQLFFQGVIKGVRQKEFDQFFFVFGTLSVTFRSLFLTLVSLFSSLFLPDYFCRTPFAAGWFCFDKIIFWWLQLQLQFLIPSRIDSREAHQFRGKILWLQLHLGIPRGINSAKNYTYNYTFLILSGI